jgi:hypothetical protein
MADLVLAAAVLTAIAAYAQYRVSFHTVPSRVALLRATLGVVAAAFGYVAAKAFRAEGAAALFVFIAGFGLVHVPAAIILFFKHAAHEGRS